MEFHESLLRKAYQAVFCVTTTSRSAAHFAWYVRGWFTGELYPETLVDMQYKMPTYSRWRRVGGARDSQACIALYACGYHHMESVKQTKPANTTGKGCINFNDQDDLPIMAIEQVIRPAMGGASKTW